MLTHMLQSAAVVAAVSLFTPTLKAQDELTPRQMISECASDRAGGANWFNTMNCTMEVYFGEALDGIGYWAQGYWERMLDFVLQDRIDYVGDDDYFPLPD